MEPLITVLGFALLIWFVYAILNPANALPIKNPTIPKIVLTGIAGIFLLGFLSSVLIDDDLENFKTGKRFFEFADYEGAMEKLKLVAKDHKKYTEAQALIAKADSLNVIAVEEMRIQTLREAQERERAEIERAIAVRDKLKNEIRTELEGDLLKRGDVSEYRGAVNLLHLEVVTFAMWKNLIEEASMDPRDEVRDLAKQLKTKVVAFQIKEFPVIRREYAKLLRKTLWEDDCDVNLLDSRNTTLEFVAGTFALNRNIKEAYLALAPQMRMFRFKRAQYKWSEYDDRYTYYTMKTPKDGQLYDEDE